MQNSEKFNVFILEDDPILSDLLKTFLNNKNYHIELERNGTDAYKRILRNDFDLIMLDISVPGMSGLDVLREIREYGVKIPVIVITGNTNDEEEIRSFKNGTNIFHKKPIQTKLLLYQMRSLLKEKADKDEIINYKSLKIDDEKKKLIYKDHEIKLTRNEYKTLLFLMRNQNRIVSKDQIIDNLYLEDSDVLESSVDTLMSRLRKKLRNGGVDDIKIVTIRSFGYRLE